ncbi:MAG: N-acyl-D-amino-acid deacylase family protein [Acidimicrobiia bacterium]
MSFDLLIRHGRVYDGSGSAWFYADVGVQGDQVVLLRGDTSSMSAARVIDATGLAVCPGFIDMHAHSTMAILHDPGHEPKVRQGVTTELLGVDGNSYAPFLSPDQLRDWSKLNAGLDGEKPLDLTWGSVAEYLNVYDSSVPVNVAYVIGNSPLRIAAVGWTDRRATTSELRRQAELLDEGLADGAFGFSTGLTYPPGSFADDEELTELSKVASKHGAVHVSHVRYGSGKGFVDPFREVIELSRRTGVALHISHYASLSKRDGEFNDLIGLVEDARTDGLQVSFDAYPYNQGGTRALVALPDWVQDGGPEQVREHLSSPGSRARMREETDPRQSRWRNPRGWHLTGFSLPDNGHLDGMSLDNIARELGLDPLDALCDLLIAEELRLSYVGHDSNNLVTVRKILEHELCAVGSDGILVGENPSPRTYGTFPKILGSLVREEKLLTFEDAIRKMTSYPAGLLGLPDRGLLRNGGKADIVVFDPEEVGSAASLEDPRRLPTGIPYVIVNGVLIVDNEVRTDATPGRALRRSG